MICDFSKFPHDDDQILYDVILAFLKSDSYVLTCGTLASRQSSRVHDAQKRLGRCSSHTTGEDGLHPSVFGDCFCALVTTPCRKRLQFLA